MQIQNMQRVNVVGGSGSGKSTFGRKLAALIDAPHVELDALHWLPNWQQSDDQLLFQKIEKALAGHNWVIDGNYDRTVGVKWKNVQTVVWLDYSFSVTFYRALTRAIGRIFSGEELWPNTGNRESFRQTFLSKDSVLLWTISQYGNIRRRYLGYMHNPDYAHIQFIQLRSPKQAKALLDNLSA